MHTGFNPYFVDLELGSGFGWGRLSGLTDYLTEEAQQKRGAGRKPTTAPAPAVAGGRGSETRPVRSGNINASEPVPKRPGRMTRFLEMF